jgi:hypothetical protein
MPVNQKFTRQRARRHPHALRPADAGAIETDHSPPRGQPGDKCWSQSSMVPLRQHLHRASVDAGGPGRADLVGLPGGIGLDPVDWTGEPVSCHFEPSL